MIRVITNHNMAINAQYIAGFAALRHQVFVERLGWDLSSSSKNYEYDQFNRGDAIYIVVCNDDDQVIAGLRLLNTTCPFLLTVCCPDLADTGNVPVGETVWEVTRFVVDPCPQRTAGCGDLTTQLVWALQSYGLLHGFTQFISVSYVGMERLLRSVGCRFSRLGAPSSPLSSRSASAYSPRSRSDCCRRASPGNRPRANCRAPPRVPRMPRRVTPPKSSRRWRRLSPTAHSVTRGR